MKILFVHQNMPGQYRHLIQHLAASGHRVVFITQRKGIVLPGVRIMTYTEGKEASPHTHHYLRNAEAAVRNGQEVARIALRLRHNGFVPDLMLGHSGWGEILYLKDVFPNTPLIGYFEYFYQLFGGDIGFDPGETITPDTAPKLRTKNTTNLLSLAAADLGQTPTLWQQSLYPKRYHGMLHVLHEGVDTDEARPNAAARYTVPGAGVTLAPGDEVLTYVGRNLEPHRGFPSFMRSLPEILAGRPNARVLIVGANGTSYGPPPPGGGSWKDVMVKELGRSVDWSRVHFLGRVPYPSFLDILRISRAHIYLTYPFVLSWSMLEAMASGCVVIGSRTPPVEEVIRDGHNGLLVDFFSPRDIAQRAISVLAEPQAYAAVRERARHTVVERYDLKTVCLPAQLKMLEMARAGEVPA
ncbi:glycosyltransferase family 4 protein [Pseudoduganella namucuonensis]|uniref:Glycosyltransferase involved in cell wall bisynthesis n=1 Tax=Pseudoduganella namucuonensis TaxID=1035707 RepID=A0A1I7M3U2_9BURK|nr:glycosyltransferase family 4 protein [Pseudoduganella namucuonensis]SFV16609.1 Glycosyltransferase involved in cell wall bisynthesis [Pseudoduganella namucuonensis]